MFLFLLLFLFLFTTKPAHAHPATTGTVPLLHQLVAAYQPTSHPSTSSPPQNTIPAVGTPLNPAAAGEASEPPQVLGLTTNQKTPSPTPPPKNIGGEGQIITIALLGDSMIDTIPDQTLLKSLQKYYPNHKFNIINYGLGASNIEYGLYRLRNGYQHADQFYPSLLSQKPDIIVIESFAYNNFGNNQSGIDRQWLALGAITTEIKQTLPGTAIILAAAIAPNSITFGNESSNSFSSLEKIEKTNTIRLYLQNIINFATSQNFPLANAYIPSLSNNQGRQQFINTTDHIHPSDQGAELFCDTIASTLFKHKLLQ